MLDAKTVQGKLDEINEDYAKGLISLAEKLFDMIVVVEVHVNIHVEHGKQMDCMPDMNQYQKAKKLLRQLSRVEDFEAQLNFYI